MIISSPIPRELGEVHALYFWNGEGSVMRGPVELFIRRVATRDEWIADERRRGGSWSGEHPKPGPFYYEAISD